MKPALLLLALTAATAAGGKSARSPALAGGPSAGQDETVLPIDDLRELGDDAAAFLEASPTRGACYVGEALRVRLRIGFEAGFREGRMIQLFQRQLDVPAQVQAPWLAGLPCAIVTVPEGSAAGRSLVIALDDDVAQLRRAGEEARGERRFEVFELERTLVPTCTGELLIPAALLRFAYATRFEEDVFQGRVPVDRHDALVRSLPLALTVLPLPEEGRPLAFSGAVGRFTIRATAEPRSLMVGESLALELRIEGEGNLLAFEPPRLAELEGFHVRGRKEARGSAECTITYDLAPRSTAVREIPPIRIATFDPGPPAEYRNLETSAITIEVRPAASPPSPGGSAEGRAEVRGAESLPQEDERRVGTLVLAALAAAALGLVALALAGRMRKRSRRPTDLLPSRVRGAAQRWRARSAEPGVDLARACAEFLAQLLDCPVPAVIGSDVRAHLASAGVPEPLARRAAALLDELVGVRFGGRASADAQHRLHALVDEIERTFAGGSQPH